MVENFHSQKNEELTRNSKSLQETDKMTDLEDRLKAIEGGNLYGVLDPTQLCLVPDVVVPKKFSVPEFEKYKGFTCPRSHLTMYCRKMTEVVNDEKLLMHCFQDSLTGASLSWYMQLESSKIKTWKDMADAFMRQYKYNLDVAPDRRCLQNMEKENNESFKAFAQRWREVAAQVNPPLSEKEMVSTFIHTLKSPYFEHMLGNVSSEFSDLVIVGERVESSIKRGLLSERRSGNSKDAFDGKWEEEQVSTVSKYQFKGYPKKATSVTPRGQHEQARSLKTGRDQERTNTSSESWVPLPMPLAEIYRKLVQNRLLTPVPTTPWQPPYPKRYNPDAACDYHSGVTGHHIEDCFALKKKVQNLIKQGLLEFESNEATPDVHSVHQEDEVGSM